MPYVYVTTSKQLTDEKIDRIQKEIGRIISIIPGKTIHNCMTQITGNCKTFMSGDAVNATFCEVRLFGKAPSDKKREFITELNKVLTDELGDLGMLYTNIQENFEWGVGPSLKEL